MNALSDAATPAPPVSLAETSPVPADALPESAPAHEPAPVHEPSGGVCASCGLVLTGPYCSRCGEKRLDRHDYAFLHFAEHAVDSFTHLDVKVLKSLWSLLRRPGAMAADLLAGRRVAWAKPFQTFIIANLLFYVGIAQTGASFFDASLEVQIAGPFEDPFRSLAEAKAARLGLSVEAYAERYDALSHTLAKTGVVGLVPVVGLMLLVLFRRHRRYFLEHTTVAALVLSQFMLVSLSALLVVALLVVVFRLPVGGDIVLVPTLIGVNAALFFGTFRRAYPGETVATLAKAAAFTVLLLGSIMYLYRTVLFLVVNALT